MPVMNGHEASDHPETGSASDGLTELRARLYYPEDDGVLFDEAVVCFRNGAYRAALVMIWVAIAQGLRHRFERAAQRDTDLTELVKEFDKQEKDRRAIDNLLLDNAKKHELIGEHEHGDLLHVKDQRNRFAHPREGSPSRMQVLAAFDSAVVIVLSRPAQHRKGWAIHLVRKAAIDRTFFARDLEGLRDYVSKTDPLLAEEARLRLVTTAVEELDGLVADPTRSDLATKVTIMAGTVLTAHPELLGPLNLSLRLSRRQLGAALLCLRPEVFVWLDDALSKAALACVLERPVEAGAAWQPEICGLLAIQQLDEAKSLPPVWAEQLQQHLAALPLDELAQLGFSADVLADRIVDELGTRNWYRQNPACRALANLGPAWCSGLPEPVQERLGRNVLQAAEGEALDASWLLSRIVAFAVDDWPMRFVYGIAAECVVNDFGKLRLKAEAIDKVDAILGLRHDGAVILAAVLDAVTVPSAPEGKEFLHTLRPVVEQRSSVLLSAIYEWLVELEQGS